MINSKYLNTCLSAGRSDHLISIDMVIYTKRGDRGETSLYDTSSSQRRRISKDSVRIEAIGSVDELNSVVGIVTAHSENTWLDKLLTEVQKDLFVIGSMLAGSKLKITQVKIKKLENTIDEMESQLPLLKNFIFPGGSITASKIHNARSVVRRAERRVVALDTLESVEPNILIYLNRLSDFLFVLARKVNDDLGVKEEVWRGR